MDNAKHKKMGKTIRNAAGILIALLILFLLFIFITHMVKSRREQNLLIEKGYYNPVSVGDYNLNVAIFGNQNGKHTIVGMAGLGSGDFDVTMRQMTASLEEDNLLIFVDRAGYGLSDDTDQEMTVEYIVEDYRTALKNAGFAAPYILMPHSIGGAYATYWVSRYPEEIEAVIFVDGSQLGEDAFDDMESYSVGISDRLLAFAAKIGLSRLVLRNYEYLLPDNYSEEEQYLSDALQLRTMDSIAPVSETGLIVDNANEAFANIISTDVPKLYICSSWGFDNWDTVKEHSKWMNRQIEKNHLPTDSEDSSNDEADNQKKVLDTFEKARQETLYPYLDKLGNCKCVLLGGDHMIYQQKPAECAAIIEDFLAELDSNTP